MTTQPCLLCGSELLLSVDRPHPRFTHAIYRRNLCPECDAADPAAQGILAFFAVNPVVTEENVDAFERLLQEWWTRTSVPPTVTLEAFDEDVDAFRRGDFD